MGNAKQRRTKENDNYGIYFYLIASKMGFTCSNTTQMLVFRVWCVRSLADEAKWPQKWWGKSAKHFKFVHQTWPLPARVRSFYYWPRKWVRTHRFGHNGCFNTNRRPMSGLYKFASTKMDSDFQTFCAVVAVYQFVIECRLRHHCTVEGKKQWVAYASAASHLISLS